MYLLNIVRRYKNIFKSEKKHLLRVIINKKNLEENISFFKSIFSKHQLSVVLKSNAYGHGLKEMGSLLDKDDRVNFFVVDNIIEAKTLRDYGIKKAIIIIGYIPKGVIEELKSIKNVILVINSFEQAKYIAEEIKFKLKVHLKVDTGMNRQGMSFDELRNAIEILKDRKNINVDGLMSHLADADNQDDTSTQIQIKRWQDAMNIFRHYYVGGIHHFSATAGTKYISQTPSNLIRVGIGAYGFDTTADKRLKVKPVLSFMAKVVNIKRLKKGEDVGYNFTYKAPRDMTIAVVPCGYYEGIPRSMSNKGVMYYQNVSLPILGRISMNLTILDITAVDDRIGIEDEIEVYSNDPQKDNSIENIAKICDTIPYEIMVRINSGIRRFVE